MEESEEPADEKQEVPAAQPVFKDLLARANELADSERWHEAVCALRRLLTDDDAPISESERRACLAQLADVYERTGLRGAAARCRGRTGTQTAVGEAGRPEDIAHGARDVDDWLDLFGTPGAVVYRQYVDRLGRHGYKPASRGLTPVYLKNHWRGRHTLAVPVYDAQDHVRFAVVDLDISRKTLDRIDGAQLERRRAELLDDARNLLELAHREGVEGILEDSGYKGYHVWFFFHNRLKASLARRFIAALTRRAGPTPEGTHRELFPAGDKRPADGLHSLIKLPLGVHRLSGRRSRFLAPDGQPCSSAVRLLRAATRNRAADLRSAIERWTRYTETHDGENPADGDEVANSGGGPGKSGNNGESQEPVATVTAQCPVLRALARKAREENDLAHHERTVVRGILEPLGETGVQAIHEILRPCRNYDFRVTEKNLGRTDVKPMGCARIREILGDFCDEVGCSCRFKPRKNDYAHPLRHLRPIARTRKSGDATAPPSTAAATPEQTHDTLEKIIQQYHASRKQLLTIQASMMAHMKGQSTVELKIGTLSCSGHDAKIRGWSIHL